MSTYPRDKLLRMLKIELREDHPNLYNFLEGGKPSFTEEQLDYALEKSVMTYNEWMPFTSYSVDTFPYPLHLVQGAVLAALEMLGLYELKNQMPFNDSGLSVDIFNKAPAFAQWIMRLEQKWYQKTREFKGCILPMSDDAGFVTVSGDNDVIW